eukprot:INCI8907.1.p1 GENE.INCI8907.1~~INCI8907.1.p1  ORF type:complete len:134 (-),score=11.34 INCI8907.1:281-682(-)
MVGRPVRGNRPEIEKRTGKLLCKFPRCDPKSCRGVVGVLYILTVMGSIVCLGFGIECFLNEANSVCTGGNGTNDAVGDSINYQALLIGGGLLVFLAIFPPVLFFVRAGIANKNAEDLRRGAQPSVDNDDDNLL